MDRYQADYGGMYNIQDALFNTNISSVSSDQFNDYLANVNNTGNSWHCELCIVLPTLACVAAREQYSASNLDIGLMDPLFHYIVCTYR